MRIISTVPSQTELLADLMLSSEPFPFTEDHVEYFREQMPSTHVMLVDGEAERLSL